MWDAAAGTGFTVNVPLEAGATDADYQLVFREAVVPVLGQFAPQLMLVSAGFDAHERDPLASMRMTTDGYAAIVRQLTGASPGGALALVTEGGYDLDALASCLDASFAAIAPGAPDEAAGAEAAGPAPRGRRALEAVRAAQAPFWRGI